MDQGNDRLILFFTPEASVISHLAAQCVLGRTLMEQGHNVRFVFCPGLFSRCPVMDMYGLPTEMPAHERKQVCSQCMQNSAALLGAYGLQSVSLADHLDHQAVLDVATLPQSMPADMRDFEYDGIPFGKICLHDLVLATKLNDHQNISPENRVRWIQYACSTVLAHLITRRLCEDLDVATVVTYQDYGILLGARLAAEARGIPVFTTHAAWHRSVDRRRVVVVPEIEFQSRQKASLRWPEWKPLPLPPADVTEVADDLVRKFGATAAHVYSPPKTFDSDDLLGKLKLSNDKKLVVAYTSSTDEYAASKVMKDLFGIPSGAPPQPFADQLDWIAQLIAHFENRDDVQLVVRIHPREGANKRESTRSQHLQQLHARFDGDHRNCLIIWPEENVSSYDLAELASLALTSWSSMGMELARLGLPVLAAFKGYQYWPHEPFLEWAPNAEAYFEKLEQMLKCPPTFEDLKLAFRWYHMDALCRTVDLGDVIPDADFGRLPPFKLPRAAKAIEQIIVEGRDVVDINLEARRQAVSAVDAETEAEADADAEEELALKRNLRRLIHILCTGKEPPDDFVLVFITANGDVAAFVDRLAATSVAPNVHFFIAGPQHSFYFFGADPIGRRSPMAVRLARAGAQFIWADEADRTAAAPVRARVVSDLALLRALLRDGFVAAPTGNGGANDNEPPGIVAPVAGDAEFVLGAGQRLLTIGKHAEARTLYQTFLADHCWDPRVVEALAAIAL